MNELYKYSQTYFKTDFAEETSPVEFSNISPIKCNKIRVRKEELFVTVKKTSEEEKDFVENYGNHLCRVHKNYCMILVESDETKCSLKIFDGFKRRDFLKPYFLITKRVSYLTYNKKSGDFYYGLLNNYHKKNKSKKVFCKNNFRIPIQTKLLNFWKESCDGECNQKFFEAVEVFRANIGGMENTTSMNQQLIKNYLSAKKIKFPNNFENFYSQSFLKSGVDFLKLKELRKSDNNLVDAVMKKFGLSGKVLKSALHSSKEINLGLYRYAVKIFPKEWLDNDLGLTKKMLDHNFGYHYFGMENLFEVKLSKKELIRVYEIFKLVLDLQINFYTFWDHIRFYNELKFFGERNIKWLSNNLRTFNDEHFKFSELVEFYKNGTYERIYPKSYYDAIQEPITFLGETYYPVLLDSSEMYNKESLVQSNCVKTYIGKCSSIIVSLRKSSLFSDERATIEYKFYNENNKITVHSIQALGKYNQKLEKEWMIPIELLDDKIESIIINNKFITPKLKKTLPNGKILSSDSNFDEKGFLVWQSVDITKYLI